MGIQEILFGGQAPAPQMTTPPPELPVAIPQGAPNELPPAMPPAAAGAVPPTPQLTVSQADVPPPPQGEMSFTDKLRSDPAVSQAIMMMGARMMQGARPGQDDLGVLGDAVMIGNATHNMVKQNQVDNVRLAEDQARKNALADATTAATVQGTKQKAALFPQTQAKLVAEVKKLNTAEKRDAALALIAEYKADPERMAEAWNLDLAKEQAQINQADAGAAANNALTKGRNFELDQEKVLADPKATAEAVEAAARTLQKGKTDKSATNASVEAQKKLVRDANPGWTEQQVAEDVLARSASAKTDNLRYAMKVLEDPMSYNAGTVDNAKAILDNHLTTAAKGKGGAPARAVPTVKIIDEAAIADNMAKYGKTREEVLQAAKAQGYTLKGE